MWNFFNKFQTKLAALLVFSTLVPVAVVGSYSIYSSTKAVTNLVNDQIDSQAANSAERIATLLDNASKEALFLSKIAPVQGVVRARENNGFDKEGNSSLKDWVVRLQINFAGMMQIRPYYTQIRYFDENGNQIVGSKLENRTIRNTVDFELKKNQSNSDFFVQAMKLNPGEIYISPIYINKDYKQTEVNSVLVFNYAIPLYSEQGRKRGVLVTDISLEYFILALKHSNSSKISQAFLINKKGNYIYHPDSTKIWNGAQSQSQIDKDYPPTIVKKILAGGKGLLSDGTEQLISYSTVISNLQNMNDSLIVVYQAPKNVVFAANKSLKIVAIIIIIISVSIVLIIGILIMNQNLNSLIAQVQHSGIQVTTSSTQIAASGKELEATITEQIAATNQVAATAKQIATTSGQLSKTMEEVAAMAQATTTSVSGGQKDLIHMEKTMRQLVEATSSIASKLGIISEKANNINSVIITITKVADQTNLLSLNAAIEAEKAGEYGLGFAVVAREIRRLADQTAVATLDIENMVKGMQYAVSSGVMEMDKFTKEVGKSVADVGNISLQVASTIEQVQALNPRFQIVNEGMDAQCQNAQQISEAMAQLSEVSLQTADSLRGVNNVIEQLNEAAQGLRKEISRFTHK